jgi:hypothetical protein
VSVITQVQTRFYQQEAVQAKSIKALLPSVFASNLANSIAVWEPHQYASDVGPLGTLSRRKDKGEFPVDVILGSLERQED